MKTEMSFISVMPPNGADHRRRASGAQNEIEASSRRSVNLPCSAAWCSSCKSLSTVSAYPIIPASWNNSE